MTDAEERTAALLAAHWARSRPLVEGRLATLDQAAVAAAAATLSHDLRVEATSSAHKLAGSVGMYGYDEGTRIAREIELLLDDCAAPDAERLRALIAELRAAILPDG
jgi:HPt (histidine-containing phosphotransfer) domain-containing protein